MSRRADLEAIREALAPVRHLPLLTLEETIDLCADAQAGDDAARAKLVRHNLRLVGKLALQWAGPLPSADLFQVGAVGLMRAIQDWDPDAGATFGGYARTWMVCYFRRAIDEQGLTVKQPSYMREIVRRVRRRVAAGEHEGLVIASEAKTTGRNPELILAGLRGSTERLVEGSPVGEAQKTPLELAADRELPAEVQGMLQELPARARLVITLTFGLAGHRSHTHAEVAKLCVLSRQRVGQIVQRALSALRAGCEDDARSSTRTCD